MREQRLGLRQIKRSNPVTFQKTRFALRGGTSEIIILLWFRQRQTVFQSMRLRHAQRHLIGHTRFASLGYFLAVVEASLSNHFCLRSRNFVPDHLRNSSGLAARNAGTVSGVSQAAMILSHRAVTAFCIPFIRKLTPSGEMLTITSPSTP